jgi:hypothetical protein
MADLAWQRPSEALRLILSGATLSATWKIALVVGTILSLANQLGPMVDDPRDWLTWLRVGFNYAVPFFVASIGYLAAYRRTTQES